MRCQVFPRHQNALLPALARVALFCCCVAVVAQPPLLYNRSITNAASFMPAGLPNGAIARGSIFTMFGSNIGPGTPVPVSTFPLSATLGGISINVVQNGSTVAQAIPLYVSAGQINAIMPSNAPLGMASIQVVNGNQKGNLAPVRIVNSAFGIFTSLGKGLGPGSLQNFISQNSQPLNSATVTAKPGQAITLWGTGLGPVSFPDNVAPTAGNLSVKTEVFVGGVSAPLLYYGRSPQFAGLDQIVFTIPSNAPTGCWVPTYVRTNGTTVSNFVTLAIQPSGGTCTTDVLPQITSAYVNGNALGENIAVRTMTHQDVGVKAPVDITSDFNVYFAFQPNPGNFPFNPALAFPPAGSCTFYTLYGDILDSGALPFTVPTTMPLDFGPALSLSGPNGQKTLSAGYTGANASYLGGSISNGLIPNSSLFLDPGTYKLQGFGGMVVGLFNTSFNIPSPPTWTNRSQITSVDRTQPLTITWSGGDSGQRVAIIGFGVDLPTNSSGAFGCMAPPGATSFTVPADILSNLPASRANVLHSKDVIYMLTLSGSSVQNLGASGLDVGITSFYSIIGKTVVLQ